LLKITLIKCESAIELRDMRKTHKLLMVIVLGFLLLAFSVYFSMSWGYVTSGLEVHTGDVYNISRGTIVSLFTPQCEVSFREVGDGYSYTLSQESSIVVVWSTGLYRFNVAGAEECLVEFKVERGWISYFRFGAVLGIVIVVASLVLFYRELISPKRLNLPEEVRFCEGFKCKSESLGKHVCVLEASGVTESADTILIEYLAGRKGFKLREDKGGVRVLEGVIGEGGGKKRTIVVVHKTPSGEKVFAVFTVPSISASGIIDLQKIGELLSPISKDICRGK